MIRILHIVDHMNRGGQETNLMNIFREIDRIKVLFDFVVSADEKGAYDNEITSLGGRIYHLPAMRKHPIRRFNKLRKLTKDNRYHSCYEALHTTGTNYIVEDIDLFVEARHPW